MSSKHYVFSLFAVLNLNCAHSTSRHSLDELIATDSIQQCTAESLPAELNSAQIVAIGTAMVTCYSEFLSSRTVTW